jgi:hypothetical protein
LGKGLRLYQTDETVDDSDTFFWKSLKLIQMQKEVLEGKSSLARIYRPLLRNKELVTLLEKK